MRDSRIGWALVMLPLMLLSGGPAAAGAPGPVPACVWIEAEKPDSANFKYDVWGGPNPQILSDGKWVTGAIGKDRPKDAPKDAAKEDIPKEGLLLKYSFEAPEAGAYEFWARIGYEWVRPALQWRIDGGQWQTIPTDQLTTNLVNVSLWCEVAWAKGGLVELKPGKHELELRYQEPGSNGKFVIGLDCFALVKGEGGFTPEGPLRPGQQYEEQIDKDARGRLFRFDQQLPGGAETRIDLPLNGLWEVARYDDPDMDKDTYEPLKQLPEESKYALRWRGLNVPGDARDRPDLVFGHRLLYRTRVDVPAQLAGRGLHLHFSGTNWIVGVFVNGQYVGGHKGVLVPWDIDITRAIKPGAANTITLSVKSSWYGMDGKPRGRTVNQVRNLPYDGNFMKYGRFVGPIYPSSKGEGDGTKVGIVNPVKLVVTGPAYTSEAFVRTGVAGKRLDADLTVSNPSDKERKLAILCQAVNDKTGQVEKAFGPVELTVPAGKDAAATVGGEWADARLWWPEEGAQLYRLRTTISSEGKPIDVREDVFGFREVSISGKDFLLNGLPWHLWNWVDVERCDNEEQWLRSYHAQNDRYHRIASDHDRLWGYREKALEFHDRHGISGRLSTCIDGMFITHDLRNPLVWENFEEHVRQVVKAYRNHPSVLMWSLENELMFITARLAHGRDYDQLEEKFVRLCKIAKELDPTRASFGDGAGDCGGLTEIDCPHYTWSAGGTFPSEAYAYRLRKAPVDRPRKPADMKELYLWDGNHPLVFGETFYYSGNVGTMAWIGGPEVFRGKSFARKAAGVYCGIATEGARWQGAAGICPWVSRLDNAVKSFEPRAVFVREHNSCFYPGSTLKRTVKVFNDGHLTDPLTLKWRIVLDGKETVSGAKTYQVPPGRDQEDTITAQLPPADQRRDGTLELELYAQDKCIFKDGRPVALLPRPGIVAGLDAPALCVFDPDGSALKWLDQIKQPYTALKDLDLLPSGAKVLLVGRDALTSQNKKTAAQKVREFVLAGKTAIVLEQADPLEGADLPVSDIRAAGQKKDEAPRPEFRAAGGQSGQISFPAALAHPVMKDLRERDFFTWGGGETSFRMSYGSPGSGAISLVQAGDELRLSPMIAIPVGEGSYLLSQMLIAERLGVEPVADRLLQNALSWAAARASAKPGRTVAYLADDKELGPFLTATGLNHEAADSVEAGIGKGADVVVVRATPQAVSWLTGNEQKVREFCQKGGWVMLVNLDAKGLDDFNRLVGFRHRLRPFQLEAVTLAARNDPLLLGLSDREVNMTSDEILFSWSHTYKMSRSVFTSVVDAADVASFAQFASPDLFRIANGLTNDDGWPYIQYFDANEASVELKYDRPETFTGMNIWTNESYFFIKDIELVFDGDAKSAQKFALEATKEKQELKFPPRKASSVTIRIVSHHPGSSKKNLVGIDNVELFRELPKDFDQRVVPLTKTAGLVKYPIGKGGIALNQIDYACKDTPQNVKKKLTIYSNLLRNMGSSFKVVLQPTPTPEPPRPAPTPKTPKTTPTPNK